MPIDRTWWNNLVDDDGSGTIGTVWNKAAIKGLLDAIDGLFSFQSFTPTLTASGGGSPIYTAQTGYIGRSDRTASFWGRVTISGKGSLSGQLYLSGLPFACNSAAIGSAIVTYWTGVSPATNLPGFIAGGTTRVILNLVGAPVGTIIGMQATDLGAADLICMGSYPT